MAIGLWLTPFLLRHIGQHEYGLWLVGLQALTWLTLMDFGIVALLPRETAYAVGRAGSLEEATDLPQILGETAWVVLCQWPLVAIAAVACWFLIPANSEHLRGAVAIVLSTFTLTFPLRIFRAVLEGLQDLSFLGRVQIFSWAAGTAISIIMVLAGQGICALALGWAVAQAVIALACAFRLRRRYPFLLPSRLRAVSLATLSQQFGRGFWVSLAQVAQVLQDGTDLLVLGKTMGAGNAVPYSCTQKLIGVSSNQPLMLMHVASPGLSSLKSAGNRAHTFRVVLDLTKALLIFSGAIACAVLAVNRGFVSWWVGAHQYGGFCLTLILIVVMILRHWNVTAVYSIFCFGYEKRISITTLIDGIVSIAASVVMVRHFGLIGAPLGSIIGVCLISLPANLSALLHESEASPSAIAGPLWPWFWRFSLAAIGSGVLSTICNPTTPMAIAVTALFVLLAYTVIMFPLLVHSPLSAYLPKRLLEVWDILTNSRPSLAYPTTKE
jgi:O-antigen/teichoic acid export membrane protein